MNHNKVVSLLVIAVLILSHIPVINAQQWYSNAYQEAVDKGYLEGMNFVADKPVTRGELIAILTRTSWYSEETPEILKQDDNAYYFDDNKPGDPYFKEIALAKEYGMVTGNNDCVYSGARPCNVNANANINRAAAAKLFSEVHDTWRNVQSDVTMPDVLNNEWYYYNMQYLANACVLQGGRNRNFYPNNNIIWAEMVVMMQRVEQDMRAPNCTPGSNQLPLGSSSNAGSQLAKPDEYTANPAEQYLVSGDLDAGMIALTETLEQFRNSSVNKDEVVLGLAMLRLVNTFKKLGNSLYTYGAGNIDQQLMVVPIFRLPVEPNPNPQKITHDRFRSIIKQFNSDMALVDKTLKDIDSDVAMMIPVHDIKLDINNSGTIEDNETLLNLMTGTVRGINNEPFYINFDRGDVHWLRGYSNFMMGFSSILLAHDTKDIFHKTGHLLFPETDTPYTFLTNGTTEELFSFVDLIAVIHEINWKVTNQQKMKDAHNNLLTMMDQSLASWNFIEKETDNNFEWVPNANQNSVIGMDLSQEMIDAWKSTLKETRSILKGEKLVPFWRDSSQGVNMRKVFYEPTTLDLVSWVHGSSAYPYLETGTMTDTNFWRNLNQIFNYNLTEFAIFLN